MKSKWLLLTKIQLTGLFDFNKARHSKDAKTVRRAAGVAAALALIGLCICAYVVFFSVEFCRQGIGAHLPALLIALSSFVTLLFSLLQGCSVLFAMKDYDHVMSLPVKKADILISRLACIYLANLLFALLVTLPGTAVLFIMDGFSIAVLGVTLAGMLFSPLLPMAVAIALSTLLTALTARFRYKNVLQILLGILLFLGVMIASFSFSFSASSQETVDMSAVYSMLVGKIYLPALLIDKTLSGDVWGIFAFIGISLAAAAAFVLIVVLCFERVHEALSARAAGVKYTAQSVRGGSAFSALVKREFKRLFTASGYLLNALSGTLLLLIAAIALLFIEPGTLFADAEEQISLSLFAYAGAGFAFFCIGMSNPAASALSLEGKSREQLFVLPLSAKRILLAKALPTFVCNAPVGLLFSVIFCVKFEADLLCWIFTPLSALLFAAFCALGGIFLNYKFPKYDWTNPTMVAKNSIPVMICVFGSMALGFACIFLGVMTGFWAYLVTDALCIVLSVVIWAYLSKIKTLYVD